MARIGVVGASGYTGHGVLWALSGRDDLEVTAVTSRGGAGKLLGEESPGFRGHPKYGSLALAHPDSLEKLAKDEPGRFPELFFLCVSHGASL